MGVHRREELNIWDLRSPGVKQNFRNGRVKMKDVCDCPLKKALPKSGKEAFFDHSSSLMGTNLAFFSNSEEDMRSLFQGSTTSSLASSVPRLLCGDECRAFFSRSACSRTGRSEVALACLKKLWICLRLILLHFVLFPSSISRTDRVTISMTNLTDSKGVSSAKDRDFKGKWCAGPFPAR